MLHVVRLKVIRPKSIHRDLISDNVLIAVGHVAKLSNLTVGDGHANTLFTVTNIKVPDAGRKLLKIKLRGDRRTGNGDVILTANCLQHVSVRRLNKREAERRTRVGLEVLNDPTAPRLNLVRGLLVRFRETIFRDETIISERGIKRRISHLLSS